MTLKWSAVMLLLQDLTWHCIVYVAYVMLPFMLLIGLAWSVHSFTQNLFYSDPWMMPVLLCMSTFTTGVLIRFNSQPAYRNHFSLFIVGCLSLFSFSLLLAQDVQSHSVISPYLPGALPTQTSFLFSSLPAVGLLGMIFSDLFTVGGD